MVSQRAEDSRDFEPLCVEESGAPPQSPPHSLDAAAAAAAARAQRNKWLAAAAVGWIVLLIFVRGAAQRVSLAGF